MGGEGIGQAQLGRQLGTEQAGPEQPHRHFGAFARHRAHRLTGLRRCQQGPQFRHLFREIVAVARQIAAQCAHGRAVGTRCTAEPQVDAPRVQRRQRAEVFRHHQRRVVGQHDAARADTDARGLARDMTDQHRGRCAGDAVHIVVLGQPVSPEAELLDVGDRPGHLQLAQHRVRRARPRGAIAQREVHADLSAAGLGRARRRSRSGLTARDLRARGPARGGGAARGHRMRSASPTSARPCCCGSAQDRHPAAPRDRLAGPPHRAAHREAARRRPRAIDPGATGLVLDPYFSASKVAWLLDHVPGARERRGAATSPRHDRQLARVAAHGRHDAHDRRQQRRRAPC
jgi:hypothetical protein